MKLKLKQLTIATLIATPALLTALVSVNISAAEEINVSQWYSNKCADMYSDAKYAVFAYTSSEGVVIHSILDFKPYQTHRCQHDITNENGVMMTIDGTLVTFPQTDPETGEAKGRAITESLNEKGTSALLLHFPPLPEEETTTPAVKANTVQQVY